MESRLQYILLIGTLGLIQPALADDKRLSLDNEYFEFGVSSGILNIQDFGSEFSLGLQTTFTASESFFLQFNYLQAEASLSSYENSQGQYFSDDDRDFVHYDVLLGYNIFQGEIFLGEGVSTLSSLYSVIGVGHNSFGGEDELAYTIGMGYKVGLSRKVNLRFDFRDYIYESTLLLGNEAYTVHNTHFTVGISYLW